VSTLPPSGLAPTLPPPPPIRARRAAWFSALSTALLAASVACTWRAQNDAALVFAYRDDAVVFGVLARVMAAGSLAFLIATLSDASQARARSLATWTAVLLAGGWLTAVFLLLR
jgi:hypothetical protein